MRHVLTLLLSCWWLAAPAMAAELEACQNLLDQRNALAEQAMKAEIALVRTIRERICPVLSQQADGANANDRNELTIDYQALIDCRHKAEEQLLRSQRVLYVNRQQFRFYTAAGAKLARQADGLDQELRDRECSQLR
jgi:predicted ATPase